MSTYRFVTYDAVPPHGPDEEWGYGMGASQEGETTTICFSTKVPKTGKLHLPEVYSHVRRSEPELFNTCFLACRLHELNQHGPFDLGRLMGCNS